MLANGAFPSNTQSWHNRAYFGLLIAEQTASVPCFLGGAGRKSGFQSGNVPFRQAYEHQTRKIMGF